jgi:uncharacterized protein
MRIVLDTNILLVSVSDRSPYHLIFKSYVENKYSLCVTTEILDEYAEILTTHSSLFLATSTLETIENATNTVFITRYFAFELIKADYDDNKFVDCAIASNADYIVTNDGHFNVLKTIPFPNLNVISIEDFIKILENIDD